MHNNNERRKPMLRTNESHEISWVKKVIAFPPRCQNLIHIHTYRRMNLKINIEFWHCRQPNIYILMCLLSKNILENSSSYCLDSLSWYHQQLLKEYPVDKCKVNECRFHVRDIRIYFSSLSLLISKLFLQKQNSLRALWNASTDSSAAAKVQPVIPNLDLLRIHEFAELMGKCWKNDVFS